MRSVAWWIGSLLVVGSAIAAAPAAEGTADKADSGRRVELLIRQLGHPQYAIRQTAQVELLAIGPEAIDALEAAATDADLEIAARARYLVRAIQQQWIGKIEPPEVAAQLKDYVQLDPTERLGRIRQLGGMPGGAGTAALCRLVRFEQSLRLSKQAAVEILQQARPGEPPPPPVIAVLREGLGRCGRVSAQWLRTWIQLAEDPAAGSSRWSRIVEEEIALLRRAPDKTAPAVVAGLLLFQVGRLQKSGRPEEARVAVRQLFELERRDTQSLLRLLDVFLRQKMWAAIEEAGSRFPNEVAMHPILLYGVAQAQAKQGKADQAEATAGKASKLFPGKSEAVLEQHVQIAGYLWRRGLPAWAEQECRHVISNTEKPQAVRRSARQLLAAMFQERGQDLKAAEELGEVVEVLRQAAPRPSGLRAESLPVMTAQMHHLYACHWLAQGDAAKHGEHLDKALAADPTHVDVLIACYRRADARPEYRRKVQEAIDACVAKMRGDVARNPGYPTTYNDLAWLVSNTEGDLDEALRFSRKSLELSPDNSSFYDTLGRVYHARGDHANALKYQTQAAELNPHSVQIARQLELFRKAQAAKGK